MCRLSSPHNVYEKHVKRFCAVFSYALAQCPSLVFCERSTNMLLEPDFQGFLYCVTAYSDADVMLVGVGVY
jgi:hypothetical protein